MSYHNFDIDLYEFEKQNDSESFKVRVTNSPAGDQSPSQAEPTILSPELRKKKHHAVSIKAKLDDLVEYGELLANCLLPSTIRQRLFQSFGLLKEDEALRLRLKFDAWQLADLPWEYMYISRSTAAGTRKEIDGFLALDRRISIARYEYIDYPLIPFEPGQDAEIRLLVLLSNPKDQALAPIQLKDESNWISESLRSVTNLTMEFLSNPTVDAVQEALERPTHIFHFAGYGAFSKSLGAEFGTLEGKGQILLCKVNREPLPFPAEKLSLNLARCGVRIALLNASESATRDSSHRSSGLASALVNAGIPAVIGMNRMITDKSAVAFSRAFYRTLAAGNTVDTAVTNGRLSIFNQNTDDDHDWGGWGNPVLYLRADDSTIFPIHRKTQKSSYRKGSAPSGLALRNILIEHFSIDELNLLCADITDAFDRDRIPQRVDLEIVGGRNLETYALNLIQHLERRGLLSYLIDAVSDKRPGILDKSKG
jgi:hypothetical protein